MPCERSAWVSRVGTRWTSDPHSLRECPHLSRHLISISRGAREMMGLRKGQQWVWHTSCGPAGQGHICCYPSWLYGNCDREKVEGRSWVDRIRLCEGCSGSAPGFPHFIPGPQRRHSRQLLRPRGGLPVLSKRLLLVPCCSPTCATIAHETRKVSTASVIFRASFAVHCAINRITLRSFNPYLSANQQSTAHTSRINKAVSVSLRAPSGATQGRGGECPRRCGR